MSAVEVQLSPFQQNLDRVGEWLNELLVELQPFFKRKLIRKFHPHDVEDRTDTHFKVYVRRICWFSRALLYIPYDGGGETIHIWFEDHSIEAEVVQALRRIGPPQGFKIEVHTDRET